MQVEKPLKRRGWPFLKQSSEYKGSAHGSIRGIVRALLDMSLSKLTYVVACDDTRKAFSAFQGLSRYLNVGKHLHLSCIGC